MVISVNADSTSSPALCHEHKQGLGRNSSNNINYMSVAMDNCLVFFAVRTFS
jgi:hypothetical protein